MGIAVHPQFSANRLFFVYATVANGPLLFDSANPKRVKMHEVYLEGDPPSGYGRLRDVVMGPDRQLYLTTSNGDGRGNCPADLDKILRITR